MVAKRPTADEIFNTALDSFCQGDVAEAVAGLRLGFFKNIYIAPALLDEECERRALWYPDADSEPSAAAEYVARFGRLWGERQEAMSFLREVWHDPLVRRELRSFTSLSKTIPRIEDESRRRPLLKERELFVAPLRIRRTQSEIIGRLQAGNYQGPVSPPRLALVLLAARDPKATVDFYRRLFEVEPTSSSRLAGGYAEFELPGVRLGVHGYDSVKEGDPYKLGSPPESLGWGTIFVIHVGDIDRYYDNAIGSQIEIVDSDCEAPGQRFFVVKDPSGYLIEVTEENKPRGL